MLLAGGGAYNVSAATVTGVESLNLASTAITATLSGGQLGAGAINQVVGKLGVDPSHRGDTGLPPTSRASPSPAGRRQSCKSEHRRVDCKGNPTDLEPTRVK